MILAALVIKIRMMLQAALLEAAVEAAAKGDGSDDRRSTFAETYCPECENMLVVNASFCMVCGTSVRSSSRQARRPWGPGGTVRAHDGWCGMSETPPPDAGHARAARQ